MKFKDWGINVIGGRGINDPNDFVIGANDDKTKVMVQIGTEEYDEDTICAIGQSATTTSYGIVKKMAYKPHSSATTIEELKSDINSLINSMKLAGIMHTNGGSLTPEQIEALKNMTFTIEGGHLIANYDDSILDLNFYIDNRGHLVVENNMEGVDFNIIGNNLIVTYED